MSKHSVDKEPCRLTEKQFNKFVKNFPCVKQYNPLLPTSSDRANKPPPGKIAVYTHWFKFGNFRLPPTKFFLHTLLHYDIGLPQMHPIGVLKIITFEILCFALKRKPSIGLFSVFFKLSKKGSWFTIEKRNKDCALFREGPKGINNWRHSFVYVDSAFINIKLGMASLLGWRDELSEYSNKPPQAIDYDAQLYTTLKGTSIELHSYPEGILVMTGISKTGNPTKVPVIMEGTSELTILKYLKMPDIKKATVSNTPLPDLATYNRFPGTEEPAAVTAKPADPVRQSRKTNSIHGSTTNTTNAADEIIGRNNGQHQTASSSEKDGEENTICTQESQSEDKGLSNIDSSEEDPHILCLESVDHTSEIGQSGVCGKKRKESEPLTTCAGTDEETLEEQEANGSFIKRKPRKTASLCTPQSIHPETEQPFSDQTENGLLAENNEPLVEERTAAKSDISTDKETTVNTMCVHSNAGVGNMQPSNSAVQENQNTHIDTTICTVEGLNAKSSDDVNNSENTLVSTEINKEIPPSFFPVWSMTEGENCPEKKIVSTFWAKFVPDWIARRNRQLCTDTLISLADSELFSAIGRIQEIRLRASDSDATNSSLASVVIEMQQEATEYRKTINDLKSELSTGVERTKMSLNMEKLRVDKLVEENKHAMERLKAMDDMLKAAGEENNRLRKTVAMKETEICNKESEIDRKNKDIEQKLKTIESMRKEAQEKSQKLVQAEMSIDHVKLLKEQMSQLENKLSDKGREMDEVGERMKQLNIRFEEAEEKSKLLANQNEDLKKENEEVKEQNEDLKKVIEDLKEHNEALKKENGELRDQSEGLKEEKRATMAAIPTIVENFITSDDFLSPLGKFNQLAISYGMHVATLEIMGQIPEADRSIFERLDPDAEKKLQECDASLRKQKYQYLERIVEDLDKPIKFILEIKA